MTRLKYSRISVMAVKMGKYGVCIIWKSVCSSFFCLDLLFSADMKMSCNCEEIVLETNIKKYTSKCNALVTVNSFSKSECSQVNQMCLELLASVSSEVFYKNPSTEVIWRALKLCKLLSCYSRMLSLASLCFVVLLLVLLIVPKVKLHFATILSLTAFFPSCNCI